MSREILEHNTEKRIELLKRRVKRCVCKYCGSNLQLRRILFGNLEDARVEIFCSHCNRIEFGVEPEIYVSAKYFVEQSEFNCYRDLDESNRTRQMTIAKVCEIMTWQNQNIGILTKEGYNVELKINENFLGECIMLTDRDLNFDLDEITDYDAIMDGE